MTTWRKSQALATRQRLVDVATQCFVRHGYAGVTTTALCQAAGVTRGALYHHFANLAEVMEAAFEQAEDALVDSVRDALTDAGGARERLLALGATLLDVLAADPVTQRIVFVEAPTALGWSRWRALDAGRSQALVAELLEELDAAGALVAGVKPRLLAQLLLGALNEAGMYAASGGAARREQAARQIELVCAGLLTASGQADAKA